MSLPMTPAQPWESVLDFAGLRFKTRAQTLGATVHCSATRPSQNFGAIDMDRMHRQRSFLCIGYHFVIMRNGVIQLGRPMDVEGAHCRAGNRNKTHVSVCLIGGISQRPQKHVVGSEWNGSDAECNFKAPQMESLKGLLTLLKGNYGFGDDMIEGHRDVKGVRKACPSFNVAKWQSTGIATLD